MSTDSRFAIKERDDLKHKVRRLEFENKNLQDEILELKKIINDQEEEIQEMGYNAMGEDL